MCNCKLEVEQLNKELIEAYSKIKALQDKLKVKNEQLNSLSRNLFGRKSEKVLDDGNYLPGLELKLLKEKKEDTSKPSDTGENTPPKPRKKTSRFEFPASAERIEKVIDLSEEKKEGLKYIGDDIVEKLVYKPGKYEVHVTRIKKYSASVNDILTVVTADYPKAAIPGSRLDESFLSHLLISKYCDHLPLYRLEQIFSRSGLNIQRQTLSSLALQAGELLNPLGELLLKEILDSKVMFTDDTPLKLLLKRNKKSKDKSKNIREARTWIYATVKDSERPLIYYEFTPDRKHEHPREILQKFSGVLHSDAFEIYERMACLKKEILWQPCWAHARRKYFDSDNNEVKDRMIRLIDKLFEVERNIKTIDFTEYSAYERSSEIIKIRREFSKPVLEEIFKLALHIINSGEFIKAEKIYKASNYIIKRKQYFSNFLNNADIKIDNNLSERNIRPIAIGRKNWLFVGSENGGKTLATIMSLTQTCKSWGINPQEYLEDVLRRINNTPKENYYELLPHKWKKL